ncbi:hypothetical protein VTO42DRAFT_7846 [Malbranchea cinnamomea]
MPGSRALGALRWFTRTYNGIVNNPIEQSTRCFSRNSIRSVATVTETPASAAAPPVPATSPDVIPPPKWEQPPVLATLYDFPSMEPIRFIKYKPEHLLLPLRKDLLHRAVIYEGDNTRQGTASTKWRNEVRGSSRKIRPQKGTGRARLGDKKSPMLRGGGVAHGPKPRDFSTELPRKIYDKAWRTALSYRYRRGQLIIVNDNIMMPKGSTPHLLKQIVDTHGWGRKFGRSLLITNVEKGRLSRSAAELSEDVRVLHREDVDVKDLLETARVIIEKKALDQILEDHSKDLQSKPRKAL